MGIKINQNWKASAQPTVEEVKKKNKKKHNIYILLLVLHFFLQFNKK